MDGTLTAFAGELWIATGDRGEIRAALQAMGDDAQNILLFDDRTGRQVDIDLEDSVSQAPRGRGRPKLGVQAREVTLLPRQWDWLAQQSGGASAVLRRLVDDARKAEAGPTSPRAAMDAAYHFTTAMAGDQPGYEEAIRALYAKDAARFTALSRNWPSGIRDHALALAAPAFA
ncbi:DUF2239 family protein [Sphingobium soli]|uniref:DUF2239 family protein n=1 Tax=Sphingobium soli TaxID=1591116 RepID=A0ABS8GZG0_9SPHN|nr:DUF2239 family protein [Sphingobium soli]MCC4231661.1 DUF2239 family protein [Sphingobium soli]